MFTVYSKPNCTFCVQAKQLLTSKNLSYNERIIDVGQEKDPNSVYVPVQELKDKVPSAKTVPQIFYNDTHIGGFVELREYIKQNEAV
jgi:glutaredoxin